MGIKQVPKNMSWFKVMSNSETSVLGPNPDDTAKPSFLRQGRLDTCFTTSSGILLIRAVSGCGLLCSNVVTFSASHMGTLAMVWFENFPLAAY
jgi:hypothetical protein